MSVAPAATVMPLVAPVIEQVPPVIESTRLTPGTGTSLGLVTVMTPEVTKPDSCAVGTAVTVYVKSALPPLATFWLSGVTDLVIVQVQSRLYAVLAVFETTRSV